MTATLEIPTITPDELTIKVLELADKYPHAVYHKGDRGQCSYIEGEVEGTPFQGCIFGIALRELGVPKEFFENLEKDGIPGIYHVAIHLRIPFKKEWKEVQNAQDRRRSWNYATSVLKQSM